MKIIDTLIIGGGISGMACGKELHEAGKDFLLLSKELGGRMLTSKAHTVDYGASYITSEYRNVRNYIDRGEPLPLRKMYLLNGKGFSTLFCWDVLRHLPSFIKMGFWVWDFKRRIHRLRKQAPHEEQRAILKKDALLNHYTKTPARDFIKQHGFEYLNEHYFEPVVQSTAFVKADQANAFYYLACLLPLVCRTWTADFRHTVYRLTKGWQDKIRETTVHKITKTKQGFYRINSSHGIYHARNVVLALPYNQARKIHAVPKSGPSISIYVLHIVGKREEIYQKKKVIFFKPDGHDITILWEQYTGSDVIFSKNAHPDLDKYYEYHHIVRRIHWENALTVSGAQWVSQKPDKGLYLASDYNICGLEDAFLTGIYAANQIMQKN